VFRNALSIVALRHVFFSGQQPDIENRTMNLVLLQDAWPQRKTRPANRSIDSRGHSLP
jgi:hypothetical protein